MRAGGRAAGRWVGLLAALTIVLSGAGCGPQDPRQAVLDERARWSVELTGFIQTADTVQATLRLSGPVNAKLRTLTVRIELIDGAEQRIAEVWEPLDVSGIQRGTPTELRVRLAGPYPEVAGMWAEVVADPTPEQQARIVELP